MNWYDRPRPHRRSPRPRCGSKPIRPRSSLLLCRCLRARRPIREAPGRDLWTLTHHAVDSAAYAVRTILAQHSSELCQNVCRNPHRPASTQLWFGTVFTYFYDGFYNLVLGRYLALGGWEELLSINLLIDDTGSLLVLGEDAHHSAWEDFADVQLGSSTARRAVLRVWTPSNRTGAIYGR
jgi:hypothetical protein